MFFSKWIPIINDTTGKNNVYITPNVCSFLSGVVTSLERLFLTQEKIM